MASPKTANPFDLSGFESHLDAQLDRIQTDPEFVAELTATKRGNPVTLGPAVIDPEEWAEKQTRNAAAAAADWLKNVLRPRRDPIKAAIAAAPKRKEKLMASLEQGKWEKAMAKVDEDLMFETIKAVGSESYRRGVTARKAKVVARAKELQPMVIALKNEIAAMPDVTDADREARLLAARRGMILIGKKRRGIA